MEPAYQKENKMSTFCVCMYVLCSTVFGFRSILSHGTFHGLFTFDGHIFWALCVETYKFAILIKFKKQFGQDESELFYL